MLLNRPFKSAASVVALLTVVLTASVFAQETVRLEGRQITAVVDPVTLAVDVEHAGVTWKMSRDGDRESADLLDPHVAVPHRLRFVLEADVAFGRAILHRRLVEL